MPSASNLTESSILKVNGAISVLLSMKVEMLFLMNPDMKRIIK